MAKAAKWKRPAVAVLGPAGSGKTTAVEHAIKVCHEFGARVLIVAPTGRLAATYRTKYPHLDVDTIHGAFLLFKREQETLELMIPYDLVVVEEVGQLAQWVFERLMTLWRAAQKLPTLVFLGDFYQLPGVEPTTAKHSATWHTAEVQMIMLHEMQRCECSLLKRKLELLRTPKPTKPQLRFILKNHKAPRTYMQNPVPTQHDINEILRETPQTLFCTISRRACAVVNTLRSVFGDAMPMAVLPSDPESNGQNYMGSTMVSEHPLEVPIFSGMRVTLTKNLNKEVGYVNGMGAEVLSLNNNAVVVRTDQGRVISIFPWTSEEHVVHYPFRLGYATTLHKIQGATLEHLTLWLDVPNMPAAAYVALSRVRRDRDWRIMGARSMHHFTPARL